jgi:hypothetical protein
MPALVSRREALFPPIMPSQLPVFTIVSAARKFNPSRPFISHVAEFIAL